MATTDELRNRLQDKLRELFQLNEPDLDFGFYRIMHAKAKEVDEFLNVRLPQTIAEAFADSTAGAVAEKEAAYAEAVKQARAFGSPDPEVTQPVRDARAALDAARAAVGAESEVYDHLHHFFERYYDKGDFVSLRRLSRETDRKAQPYAIPYAGEEVKLHWANADQYYVKTGENFSHFAFDAAKHPEIARLAQFEKVTREIPESCPVRFEVVDADEGAHGNVKQDRDRFFILHAAKPCEMKDGALVVYFEYRADPDKAGTTAKWQERRRLDALAALKEAVVAAGLPPSVRNFLYTDLDRDVKGREPRILLDVYLRRYVARNTADYFIHKDLGGFLRRELDFYVKNEMIALDDFASATPEAVAKWLGKVQVFRRIAERIIAFLAQLEDFQKRLWLKKKLVVQCDYCLTLDRVPEEMLDEVFANEAQKEEWKRLGLPTERANEISTQRRECDVPVVPKIDARMVDTKFFDEPFKQRLLASIDDFDANCDGVLVHGENFQALNLLSERYRSQVKCIYIDPPYNTGSDNSFAYKDSYQHSSWNSFMIDRAALARNLMDKWSGFLVSTDDGEYANLRLLLADVFGDENFVADIIWNSRKSVSSDALLSGATNHTTLFAKSKVSLDSRKSSFRLPETGEGFSNPDNDPRGPWKLDPLDAPGVRTNSSYVIANPITGEEFLPPKGRHWSCLQHEALNLIADGRILFGRTGKGRPGYKRFLSEATKKGRVATTLWTDEGPNKEIESKLWDDVKTTTEATNMLLSLFGSQIEKVFIDQIKPKPIQLVQKANRLFNASLILDYFAGSGTTGHAAIELNRQDGGKRKYVLVEMGEHFDTVLKPRIEKVVYSPEWKDGRPVAAERGVSHCFKYLRLESYEDVLNNLVVDGGKGAAFGGVGDYFFRYMLDVETRESPSLMNAAEFADPFSMRLSVKRAAGEEREERVVDIVETFSLLIGLRVARTDEVRSFGAEFERPPDPELPGDANTRLCLKGRLRQAKDGAWRFRTVEGWTPRNRFAPDDGARDRVLVVWRTLTDDREKDNAVLDAFL